MKKLFEMLKQGLIRLAESESGEFLSTRRKAHLLHSQIYARLGAEDTNGRQRPATPARSFLGAHRCGALGQK